MIKKLITFFLLITSLEALAEPWRYQMRGFLSGRLSSYTEEKSKNYGQRARAQFEHATQFSGSLDALNQLRWTSNSIVHDLSTKSTPSKKDSFETYLGENYIKYKGESLVVQIGYQEVVWGEAFGFNYADIIGPKDQRETFFSDSGDARLPLLLFNAKTFFSSGEFSGSLQLLTSPEPRFSKSLPVEIYAGHLFPQSSLIVTKEKTPQLFDKNEVGGKLSASYAGFDTSLFTYSYYSRDPHYTLDNVSLTSIAIKEAHTKVQSHGLSLAKTVYDFVFRADIVQTEDKMVNYVTATGQLEAFPTTTLNAVVSLDSPTYNNYSFVLVFAQSTLSDIMPNSFRRQEEQYAIGKITRTLENDKTLEFSYIHEFDHSAQSVQTFINWPVNSSTDLKLGGEFYLGSEGSNLKRFQNISSVFISLKNYFQL